LDKAFPDFDGELDFDICIEYIIEKFCEVVKSEDKTIYPHVTCATDTKNIHVVWTATQDIILSKCLNQQGFDL